MRRERREETRCGNEGEEHRGENQEGTRLTDRGRQRADHRKNLKAQGMKKQKHDTTALYFATTMDLWPSHTGIVLIFYFHKFFISVY